MSQIPTISHKSANPALNNKISEGSLESRNRDSLNDEEIQETEMNFKLNQRLLQGRNASDINKGRRTTTLMKLERSAYRLAVDF